MRQSRGWRDGEYPDLRAARRDAIVEAKNLLLGGAVPEGAIEIRDAGGHLVSQIQLRDFKQA